MCVRERRRKHHISQGDPPSKLRTTHMSTSTYANIFKKPKTSSNNPRKELPRKINKTPTIKHAVALSFCLASRALKTLAGPKANGRPAIRASCAKMNE